jgi:hypothetical protein
MTGQQLDVLHNNGRHHDVLEVEGGGGYIYQPQLNLTSISTACAKGYLCHYEVSTENGNLLLKALRLRTSDSIYPRIGGHDPVLQIVSFNSGGQSTLWADYDGLNEKMTHFTGRIMLGSDDLKDGRHDHHGATCYKTIWEIHVQQGKVVKALNVSEKVAARRQQNEQRQAHEDYHFYSWQFDLCRAELERKRLARLAGDFGSDDEDDL